MNTDMYDLTGFADLLAYSLVEVFPGERAELRVPHRGTVKVNYAIAYCWLQSCDFAAAASVESSKDEIIVNFNLTEFPFSCLNRDQLDHFLDSVRCNAAEWVHERFLSLLSEHSYIFEEFK